MNVLVHMCGISMELLNLFFFVAEANILALQVKIDTKENNNKKDASTQVFIGFNKKKKSKY